MHALKNIFCFTKNVENDSKLKFNFGQFKYYGYYDFVLIKADNLKTKLEKKKYIVQNNEILH